MKKLHLVLTVVLLCVFTVSGGTMTISSGDYKFAFAETPHLWTMCGIWYKGKAVAHRSGYYGNVFSPANGKYIGAGHTEGGLEKLLSAKVNVDGKEFPVVKNAAYKGKKIVYTRVSMLDRIKMFSKYTLDAGGMVITKHFEATDEQSVYQLYLYQICWGKESTEYRLFRNDGSEEGGKFFSKGKFPVYGESKAFALSQYYPSLQTGVINAHGNFSAMNGINLLWDRPGYHKYYYWVKLPEKLNKNWKSAVFQLVIRAFDAPTREAWLENSAKAAKKIIAEYPPAPLPDKIKLFDKESMVLPPSSKFQCKKAALPLMPDTNYSISCQIKKDTGISSKASDNCLLIGYYDAKRKFHGIRSFAGALKGDGTFHDVSGTFKTPEITQDIYLYVYNSRSTGSVTVKNIIVEKIKK